MRRNQYEEALFRCEDDRFEADVLLETTRSAIARLELLRSELDAMTEEEAQAARLSKDALSAVQLAAIRRIYAQNGIDQEVLRVGAGSQSDAAPQPEPESVYSAGAGAAAHEGACVDAGEGGGGRGRG